MERRHEEMLEVHLEEVYGQGWSVLPWWKMYTAFDADRINKNAWRYLLERWRALTAREKTKHRLMAYKDNGESVLLICGDPPGAKHLQLQEVAALADDTEHE
jgi:hypothetical protein